ncbi:MAG: class I SAM-dependent methyltransferase [Methanotrichaceae archaeon]|nr:class I SAM-dependent methyltransferase [Methanotrichaceae archaeon]
MTGVINWNELWKVSHHNGFHHHGEDLADHWDRRAREFNRMVMRHKERAEAQVSSLGLSHEDTVLDIGAGTGRLAIPMARIAKSVTALDQSGGMLACLKENMDREGLSNIQIVQKSWQDLSPDSLPGHDVVLSSNSLGVSDLQEALSKMDGLAKKAVYIFTFADRKRDEGFHDFLGQKHHHHHHRASNLPPDYIIIYNLLAEMGILADVKIVEWEAQEHYSSLEEAVASWKEMHEILPEKEPQLREFLSQKLEKDDQGLCMHRRSKQARISWQKSLEGPA